MDFDALPPDMRAFALVGYYLSHWASMEFALEGAIGKSLQLGPLQQTIVARNLPFGNKIKVLRTLANIAMSDKSEIQKADKFLIGLATLSNDRNMPAHVAFGADETGDGVVFLVTKASGKLRIPEVKWSVSDFKSRAHNLLDAIPKIKKIERMLSRSEVVNDFLSQSPKPTPKLSELAAAFLAVPPSPLVLDFPPLETKDAKSPPIPPDPEN